jgi:L-aminopeptidase/D-esterase-like protein
MLTAVPGFKVGHHTDVVALTGCTVILCPPNTRASCEVRGASPGSRELAMLAPDKKNEEIHALLFAGGSAFGLAAADGVMRWLEERNIGYQTPWMNIPLVPSVVVFDLNVGNPHVRPDPGAGYAACESASSEDYGDGNLGAGTGATVGKWSGIEYWMKGGVGSASATSGDLVVGLLAVVNAVGDIVDERGNILAGARSLSGEFFGTKNPVREFVRGKVLERSNTTLVVAATNAELSKVELHRVCQRMHDGMARAIIPVHTSYDGDATFALSQGSVHADIDFVAEIAADLTAQAIRRAVLVAKSLPDVPGIAGR